MPSLRRMGSGLNRMSIAIEPVAGPRPGVGLTETTTSFNVPIAGQFMICSAGVQSGWIGREMRCTPAVPLSSIARAI